MFLAKGDAILSQADMLHAVDDASVRKHLVTFVDSLFVEHQLIKDSRPGNMYAAAGDTAVGVQRNLSGIADSKPLQQCQQVNECFRLVGPQVFAQIRKYGEKGLTDPLCSIRVHPSLVADRLEH